ncbi:hypothetical protein ROHU_028963 [Labeo rohita]|uniref:Uncharacterized protein n=1 Tax=Labeo rohita TaxID=84645 RepID=A0A498LZK6_LABRO|nr:hypothetical protein ROHU_028963 [Labeo rohita]
MSFSRYKVQIRWSFPTFSRRNIHRARRAGDASGREEIHTVKHEITGSSADPAVCDSHQKPESGVQARLRRLDAFPTISPFPSFQKKSSGREQDASAGLFSSSSRGRSGSHAAEDRRAR